MSCSVTGTGYSLFHMRNAAGCLLLALLTGQQAFGQALPSGLTPPPLGSPLPGILQREPPAVSAAPAPGAAAPGAINPAAAAAVTDATIEGATAYQPANLQPYLADLIGPAVPISRVEAARTAIVNRYRADGYAYTAVNVRIHAGHLRLIVTEGHIIDVKLDGRIGPAGEQVLRFLRRLTDIRPLTTAALERALLLASDVPGLTVRGIINPSADDPGALTLVAQVTRQAVSGQISADNRAFRQTGPEELLAVADFNSFTSLGERTEVSIYHTFDNTNTFGQASEGVLPGRLRAEAACLRRGR